MEQVMVYVIGVGIVSVLGMLIRLDRKLESHNTSLNRLVEEYDRHVENDRQEFRRLYDKVEELRWATASDGR